MIDTCYNKNLEKQNPRPINVVNIMKQNKFKSKCKINKIDVTNYILTGRGG